MVCDGLSGALCFNIVFDDLNTEIQDGFQFGLGSPRSNVERLQSGAEKEGTP